MWQVMYLGEHTSSHESNTLLSIAATRRFGLKTVIALPGPSAKLATPPTAQILKSLIT